MDLLLFESIAAVRKILIPDYAPFDTTDDLVTLIVSFAFSLVSIFRSGDSFWVYKKADADVCMEEIAEFVNAFGED